MEPDKEAKLLWRNFRNNILLQQVVIVNRYKVEKDSFIYCKEPRARSLQYSERFRNYDRRKYE